MSQTLEEGPLQDAAILTRAVESVFRKLVRLLMGRMSLIKLQEMIRIVFVEEAEEHLKKEQPGRKVAMTKLALLTGLDTRTLSRILGDKTINFPLYKKEKFLREMTPEGTVLDYWKNNRSFLKKTSLEPLVLDIKGSPHSFEALVKETLSARGVTPSSILKNLVYAKSVHLDSIGQKVTLLNSLYMPFDFSGNTAQLEISLATVGNLIQTIIHNFETKNHSEEAFFQRASWSHRFNPQFLLKLRKEIKGYLIKAEQEAVKIMENYEEDEFIEGQRTAGFGLFYFEDETSI